MNSITNIKDHKLNQPTLLIESLFTPQMAAALLPRLYADVSLICLEIHSTLIERHQDYSLLDHEWETKKIKDSIGDWHERLNKIIFCNQSIARHIDSSDLDDAIWKCAYQIDVLYDSLDEPNFFEWSVPATKTPHLTLRQIKELANPDLLAQKQGVQA